jgi:hypothetical protein
MRKATTKAPEKPEYKVNVNPIFKESSKFYNGILNAIVDSFNVYFFILVFFFGLYL